MCGVRVEFGEIESALTTHPGVRRAVVTAPADPDDVRVLHAYAEETAGAAPVPTEAELKDHLRGRLPGYLVPARVLVLARLPRTTTGKADRAALPPIPFTGTAGEEVRPRGEPEERTAAVIAAVLGLNRVGRTDRLDDLGGDSSAAARVVARLRAELGVTVPIGDLLAEPTVASLARRVSRAPRAVPPPVRHSRTGLAPRSGPRTTRQVSGFPGATTEAFALGITGRIGPAELAAALEDVVVRHEALRTIAGADRTRSEVLAAMPVPFTEHDARAMNEADIRRLIDQAARPSFASDEDAPLLRATLLRTGEAAAALVIAVGHLAFDGWSGGIVLAGLAAAPAGTEPAGPAVQPADLARWDERLFTAFADTDQALWTAELAGARPPYDVSRRPRIASPGNRGASLVRPLAMETAEAVRELGSTTGLGEFPVYLAALGMLLARWSGIHDVLIGVPVGRPDLAELDGVIGPLLPVLPLCVRREPGQNFRAVVARAAMTRNRAEAHTNLPVEMLSAAADAAGVERLPGVPLAPVTLVVRPSGTPVRVRAGDRELWALGELDTGVAPNEAAFLVDGTAAGTDVQPCDDVDRFDRAEVGALMDGFLRVLAEGTANPDRACSAIELPMPPRSESLPSTVGGRPRAASSTAVEKFLATTRAQLPGDVTAADPFLAAALAVLKGELV